MYTQGLGSTEVPPVGKMDSLVSKHYSRATKKTCPNVAVISLCYKLEKYKELMMGLQLQNNPSSAETSHTHL